MNALMGFCFSSRYITVSLSVATSSRWSSRCSSCKSTQKWNIQLRCLTLLSPNPTSQRIYSLAIELRASMLFRYFQFIKSFVENSCGSRKPLELSFYIVLLHISTSSFAECALLRRASEMAMDWTPFLRFIYHCQWIVTWASLAVPRTCAEPKSVIYRTTAKPCLISRKCVSKCLYIFSNE